MMNINTTAAMLSGIKGATIMTITTDTVVRMRKRCNPLAYKVVTKVTVRNCQFGYNYQNAVNSRILKETGEVPNFKSDSLPWGDWLVPNKIIEYRGNLYGRFYTMDNNVPDIVTYYVNGKLATPEQVEIINRFSSSEVSSERQAAAGLVNHQVKPFLVNLENILEIKVNGNVILTA